MQTKAPAPASWSYQEAFIRNLGLVNSTEQDQLRRSRVAVAGLGGVGGVDLVTLARLGVGRFTIADPDIFETRNTNRQYGATVSAYGRYKVDVMRDIVLDINPEAEIRAIRTPLGPENSDEFLDGANVLVDGIDAFEIKLRRHLFGKARERGMFALGAGPVGFSTAWVIFAPDGMSFDRYFDLSDSMDRIDEFSSYIAGMAPSALHRSYVDLAFLDFKRQTGPSAGLACNLASAVVAVEVLKILLGRGRLYCAPYYHQFDPYLGRYVRRRLTGGNRHPLQKVKRRFLANYIKKRIAAASAEGN